MNQNKIEANKEQRPTDVASGAVLGHAPRYEISVENWPYNPGPIRLNEALLLARKHLRPVRNKPGAKSVTIKRIVA